jgi:hypothetical protein
VLERAAALFPFAIAVVLPPAGAVIGIVALGSDRELGIRLIAVAVLAALIWWWAVFS